MAQPYSHRQIAQFSRTFWNISHCLPLLGYRLGDFERYSATRQPEKGISIVAALLQVGRRLEDTLLPFGQALQGFQ